MENINFDNRYNMYPEIRGEDVVRFIGGPLDKTFQKVDYLSKKLIVPVVPEFSFHVSSYIEPVNIKNATYKLEKDTVIVLPYGLVQTYCYIFSGID